MRAVDARTASDGDDRDPAILHPAYFKNLASLLPRYRDRYSRGIASRSSSRRIVSDGVVRAFYGSWIQYCLRYDKPNGATMEHLCGRAVLSLRSMDSTFFQPPM